MKIFVKNQYTEERVVRFIVSVFLIPAPLIFGTNPFSVAQSIVGGILLFNAFSGMCAIYRVFGANTCEI
jgi:hypothetical protein